ncbi:hypothetical protein [Streptomyces sp. 4N124]|uniref:hypothetical protein n=1 Tax=Streptomyces sp. 4N124 TaxID=3457420 RepID=UPI003FD334C4
MTVIDVRGRQLVRSVTNETGECAVVGLSEECLSVVVSAPGMHPMVHRTLLRTGTTIRSDFALHGRPRGRHAKPAHVLDSPS